METKIKCFFCVLFRVSNLDKERRRTATRAYLGKSSSQKKQTTTTKKKKKKKKGKMQKQHDRKKKDDRLISDTTNKQ